VYPSILRISPGIGERDRHVALSLCQNAFICRREEMLVTPVDKYAVRFYEHSLVDRYVTPFRDPFNRIDRRYSQIFISDGEKAFSERWLD